MDKKYAVSQSALGGWDIVLKFKLANGLGTQKIKDPSDPSDPSDQAGAAAPSTNSLTTRAIAMD
ncbi:MAG: hypothetical protein ACKOOI_08465 [Pirellula sp.]